MRIRGVLGVLAVLGLVGVGCGSDEKAAVTTVAPATTAAPATTEAPSSTAPATTAAATTTTVEPVKPLDPPVKVRFAVSGVVPEAGLFVALERGYFADEGIDLEFVNLRRFSEALPLLATGDLEFSSGGLGPDLFNANLQGVDVKIIAANAIGVPGSAPAALVVRQQRIDDGSYKDLSSLKGYKIAINSPGSSSQLHVEKMLAEGGLTKDDVEFVVLGFADMPAALTNGAIDAAFTVEPFVASMVKGGIGKAVAIGDQTFPGAINQVLVISPEFAKKNSEAANRVMYAFLRGQREYLDAFITGKNPAGQKDIIDILTKHTAIKDPAGYEGIGMSGGDYNGEFDLDVVKQFQDYFKASGSMDKEIEDLSTIVDLSYVEYAAKRLDSEK